MSLAGGRASGSLGLGLAFVLWTLTWFPTFPFRGYTDFACLCHMPTFAAPREIGAMVFHGRLRVSCHLHPESLCRQQRAESVQYRHGAGRSVLSWVAALSQRYCDCRRRYAFQYSAQPKAAPVCARTDCRRAICDPSSPASKCSPIMFCLCQVWLLAN